MADKLGIVSLIIEKVSQPCYLKRLVSHLVSSWDGKRILVDFLPAYLKRYW